MTTQVHVIKLLETNKAKLAFLVPFIAAVGVSVASWIVSGDFDATEIRSSLGGTVLAAFGYIGAYLAPAGKAEVSS